MKKLLLLIGLVVFLTPMVVSANELQSMQDIRFCFGSTKVDYKKGTGSWKDEFYLSSSVNFTSNELINEAKRRNLSLLECINISGKLKILEKKGIKLKLLDEETKEVAIVNENKIKKAIEPKSYKFIYANEDYYEILGVKDSKKYDDKIFSALLEVTFNQKIKRKGVLDPIHYRCSNKDGIVQDKRFSIKRESLILIQGLDVNFNKKPCKTELCEIQVKEAYCVLSDPEKRKIYALYGLEGLNNPSIFHYDGLSIALGCGKERKDKDDCVKKYLGSLIGSSIDDDQLNEVKKDREMMNEIVLAINEMNRAQNQSNEASQEEQVRAEEGYYKEQSNGNYVWVDTRSGAEKFTDRFCFNCTSAQVYMINRATKRYFQNAPLSGFDKFILRGGNTSKVIKFYK